MKISIDQMIIYKGDPSLTKGAAAAYNNILEGRGSKSKGKPVVVTFVPKENKYLVMDGLHRIIEGLIDGQRIFECVYDWDGTYSHLFWIPPVSERFEI